MLTPLAVAAPPSLSAAPSPAREAGPGIARPATAGVTAVSLAVLRAGARPRQLKVPRYNVSDRVARPVEGLKMVASPHVMFSHCWGADEQVHRKVLKVSAELKKKLQGLTTWVDEEKVTGNIFLEAICAVQDAECVVVVATREYQNRLMMKEKGKHLCSDEFQVARREGKPIVTVVMDEELKRKKAWGGPLAAVQGDLYIDMSGDLDDADYLEEKVVALAERIEQCVREHKSASTLPQPVCGSAEEDGEAPHDVVPKPSPEINSDRDTTEQLLQLLCEAEKLGIGADSIADLRARLHSPTIKVAVLGLCKSGKSTFCNALIGQEFLPAANEPATACMLTVKHDPDLEEGRLHYHGEIVATGAKEIRERLVAANNEGRHVMAKMADWAYACYLYQLRGKTFPEFRLEVSAEAFRNVTERCGAGEAPALSLIDFPGANENLDGMKDKVLWELQKVDAVLYVLDFTKLYFNDEAEMLGQLSKTMGSMLSSMKGSGAQRMYFVLNKIDTWKKRQDPPLEETLERVAKQISKETGHPISPDKILPMAAEKASMARQVKRRSQDSDYLEAILATTRGCLFKEHLDPKEYEAAALQDASKLLKDSGISAVETRVLGPLAEDKVNIRNDSVIDLLIKQMDSLKNDALVQLGDLDEENGSTEQDLVIEAGRLASCEKLTRRLKVEGKGLKQALCKDIREQKERMEGEMLTRLSELFGSQGSDATDIERSTWQQDNVTERDLLHLAEVRESLEQERGSDEGLQDALSEMNDIIKREISEICKWRSLELIGGMTKRRSNVQEHFNKLLDPVLQEVLDDGRNRLHVPLRDEHIGSPESTDLEKELRADYQDIFSKDNIQKEPGLGCWQEGWQMGLSTDKYSVSMAELEEIAQDTVKQRCLRWQVVALRLMRMNFNKEVARAVRLVEERIQRFVGALQERQEMHKVEQGEIKKKLDAVNAKMERIKALRRSADALRS